MSTRPNEQKRGSRRKGGYRRQRNSSKNKVLPTVLCAICAREIKDMKSALAQPSDNAAVHFNCALKEMRHTLKPGKRELVIYLGKGSFALVDSDAYHKQQLKVIKCLDWEKGEEIIEWRKSLATAVE